MFSSRMRVFLVVLLLVFSAIPLIADTMYYQPTPFPLKKANGSSMSQDLNIVHSWDGWITDVYYNQEFMRDDRLQIGGWGDVYLTYLRWDLKGLPYNPTTAILYLTSFNRGDGSTTTPFQLCRVASQWDLSMDWNSMPSLNSCTGYYAAPTPGNMWGINFTTWYNDWKNGNVSDYGLALLTQYNNNNFTMFRSSRYSDYSSDPYADGKRPILRFDFTPTLYLKMPLPGNHSWLVTNEIGGYECMGGGSYWPDEYHMGSNYFSIDFSWRNLRGFGGAVYEQSTDDIPILAAAGGKVYEATYSSGNG